MSVKLANYTQTLYHQRISVCLYLQVYRMEDGLGSKLDSEERKGLKVSVKVFISSLKKEALVEALDSGKNLSSQMQSFPMRHDFEPVLFNNIFIYTPF